MNLKIIMISDNEQKMFENDTIRKFSGLYKKVYRLLMVQYFCSGIFNNGERFLYAKNSIDMMYLSLLSNNVTMISTDTLKNLELNCATYLTHECGLNILKENCKIDEDYINEENILKAVSFFQSYRKKLKDGKTLYLYKDIESFWNLESIYQKSNIKVLAHHWLDLNPFLNNLPVLTFPEYFAYQDLINLWNDTLDKEAETKLLGFSHSNEKSRERRYSYFSSLRTSLILGVQFCETYLYYLFYNIKNTNNFNENSLIQRKNIRSINDEQIIEDLLYVEFPELKDSLDSYFKKYQESLEYRNAFVHMSAFTDDNSDLSRMQRLINIDIEQVSLYLQNIINMLQIIENNIGDYKVLFWWKNVDNPNFEEKIKMSALMKNQKDK